MKVQLDYFDINGKWVARGGFETEMAHLHQVMAEAKWLMQRNELPDVSVSANTIHTVLVEFDGMRQLIHAKAFA